MTKTTDMQKTVLWGNVVRCLLICSVPAAFFYVITVWIMSMSGFSYIEMTRDPAQQTDTSSFLGFLSNIGSWLWVSGAAFCFFRIATDDFPVGDTHRTLLILIGGFSFFLAVDDFFLIHDRYIAEGIIVPLYAIFIGYVLKRFRAKIFEIDGAAFLLAMTSLAMSVLVDAVQEILPIDYGLGQALEEGFKFVGIATWTYFCFQVAAFRSDASAAQTGT